MEYACPNCNHSIIENFCGNCGQKKFKRIDKKYVLDEVQYSLIHTNKGFLYSAKKILKNPGKTAREFIEGNRVNHYKPLLLVFLLSGISAFISFKVIGLNEIMSNFYSSQEMNSKFMNDVNTFISSYYSILMLILIPFVSVFTKLTLRKWGQNYYEHIIMNAYGLAFYSFIYILAIYPILYFLRNNLTAFAYTSSLSGLIVPIIGVWFYKGFYPDKPVKTIIFKVLIILCLVIVAYIAFVIITMLVVGFIAAFTIGPEEALKYLQTQSK